VGCRPQGLRTGGGSRVAHVIVLTDTTPQAAVSTRQALCRRRNRTWPPASPKAGVGLVGTRPVGRGATRLHATQQRCKPRPLRRLLQVIQQTQPTKQPQEGHTPPVNTKQENVGSTRSHLAWEGPPCSQELPAQAPLPVVCICVLTMTVLSVAWTTTQATVQLYNQEQPHPCAPPVNHTVLCRIRAQTRPCIASTPPLCWAGRKMSMSLLIGANVYHNITIALGLGSCFRKSSSCPHPQTEHVQ